VKYIERIGQPNVKQLMDKTAFGRRVRQSWEQDFRPLLILALVLFSVRSSLADWNDVPTGSMKPTILEGDRIFVNKLAYDLKVPFTTWHLAQWANPQRGDVVVFYSPHDGTRLVKRVIGLPGDVIELQNERLIINGKPMEYGPIDRAIPGQLPAIEREESIFAVENLGSHRHAVMAIPGVRAMRNFGPERVPDGAYFMMGDNRDDSFDSRYFGTVKRKEIVGKATEIVMSINKSHYWLPRGNRFFRLLDAPSAN
jgi:signal peptidase I